MITSARVAADIRGNDQHRPVHHARSPTVHALEAWSGRGRSSHRRAGAWMPREICSHCLWSGWREGLLPLAGVLVAVWREAAGWHSDCTVFSLHLSTIASKGSPTVADQECPRRPGARESRSSLRGTISTGPPGAVAYWLLNVVAASPGCHFTSPQHPTCLHNLGQVPRWASPAQPELQRS